ncbi:aminoglycoside phosphotransferase [Thiopseudomonas alkaliphila]|uniref:phosphotransferase family protein n=1 Tax=Thiopseudomonas alkaliphila TaxID=1697053 RepID=UPI00069D87DD|nr:phosphotransferase family protein [Thiopseudomonas alkaliphila]AKX55264.1 aminoglycoside phosphotransferase [Thiopseudomonas alkaliphila]
MSSLNEVSLNAYLQEKLVNFTSPAHYEKFSGGQSNPTFLVTTEGQQFVLRRKPEGNLLPSAHAVDREFTVIKALNQTQVPVPEALLLCDDDRVIGSMFYVMSYVEGRIFWDPSLPEFTKAQRSEAYQKIIQLLADIHEVDLAATGLTEFGKAGNYFQRQLERWIKQYRASETEPQPAIEQLIVWLEHNLPADDGQLSLIHGDYRLDNLVFAKDGVCIKAVLDWELATLGHPLADLAYFCMCLRLPSIGPYKGLAQIDRAALGIPTEEQLKQMYCAARNCADIPNWKFYLAFSFFRLTAIVQGVLKRALQGNASNKEALLVGKIAPQLARMALASLEE